MMRKFTYRSWARTVEVPGVASVEFAPAHVVFRSGDGTILLAVKNEDVNDLREITHASE